MRKVTRLMESIIDRDPNCLQGQPTRALDYKPPSFESKDPLNLASSPMITRNDSFNELDLLLDELKQPMLKMVEKQKEEIKRNSAIKEQK